MKKVCSILLMFLFILNIEAATSLKTYNESVKAVKTYIDNFEDSSRYIVLTNDFLNIPFLYESGKVDKSPDFNGNGGLLNEDEYNIGEEYLFNGLNFWLVGKKIVNNDKSVKVLSDDSTESGIRVTEFVKPGTRVIGEGTRINPWEFVKKQYEVTIIADNAFVSQTPIYISEGSTDGVTVSGYKGYAFDSVSCTNGQSAKYEDGKLKVIKISDTTVCNMKFINPGQTFSYKEKEQTYEVKYSGYYEITAYGAQGNQGGKGGQTSGVIYLEKGQKVFIKTGGQNGYNGGGAGQFNGGGASTVTLGDTNLMIAAGGGGGKLGTAGGNGDSKGGESVGAGSGTDGTNSAGGGSSYDYTYTYNCSDCYTGQNTCVGGYISANCSYCYYGSNTCRGGYEYSNCSDCYTGSNTCTGGYISSNCSSCYYGSNTCKEGYVDTNCSSCKTGSNTCQPRTTTTCLEWERVYGDYFTGTNYWSCVNGQWQYQSATNRTCTGRNAKKTYSCSSMSGSCTTGATATTTCYGQCSWDRCIRYKVDECATGSNTCKYGCDSVYKACATGSNTCSYGCDEVWSECVSGSNTCKYGCDKKYIACKTGSNTCSYGCDEVWSECKSGSNTCKYGCDKDTKPYNSGHGGTNLLNKDLINPKSENGTRSGNGIVTISYYGERI